MRKRNNAIEPTSLYFAFSSYPKFWYYASDPGVKHNNIQCRTCVYRSNQSNGDEPLTRVGCDYILITGHMRKCMPAPNCKKYKKGKRIKAPNEFNPHTKPGAKPKNKTKFIKITKRYSK